MISGFQLTRLAGCFPQYFPFLLQTFFLFSYGRRLCKQPLLRNKLVQILPCSVKTACQTFLPDVRALQLFYAFLKGSQLLRKPVLFFLSKLPSFGSLLYKPLLLLLPSSVFLQFFVSWYGFFQTVDPNCQLCNQGLPLLPRLLPCKLSVLPVLYQNFKALLRLLRLSERALVIGRRLFRRRLLWLYLIKGPLSLVDLFLKGFHSSLFLLQRIVRFLLLKKLLQLPVAFLSSALFLMKRLFLSAIFLFLL